jgi:hypothetical protein
MGAPHRITLETGEHLAEFPSSVISIGPVRVPFSGGGYLRLLPYKFIHYAFQRLNRAGGPVCVYLHPREIDPSHPRLHMSLQRHFQSYVNLRSTERKLRQLLTDFRFAPLVDVLTEHKLLDVPGAFLRGA